MVSIGTLAAPSKARAARKSRTPKHYAVVPEGYEPTRPYHDQQARFFHEILKLTSLTKERRELGHWISFSDDKFRRMFGGGNYYKVKRLVIESGYLERNPKYCTGGYWNGKRREAFPQSFRLHSDLLSGRYSTIKLDEKPRDKKPPQWEVKRLTQVGQALRNRFDDFVLPEALIPLSPWDCYAMNRLRARDYHATRCKWGRFHSNFTSLSKQLRQTLQTKDGTQLGSIDIRNSQPLVLGILVRETIKKSRQERNTICTPFSAHIDSCVDAYLSECESGKIYEFVRDRFHEGVVAPYLVEPKPIKIRGKDPATGKRVVIGEVQRPSFMADPSEWDRDGTRNKTKDAFVVCLFDEIDATLRSPVCHVLKKDFTPVADYIVEKKRDGYQALATECQKLESQIMIDGVAAEFMKRHPESPILTIHDEIIVPVDRLESLKQLIELEFAKYGVKPSTKETLFNKEEAL